MWIAFYPPVIMQVVIVFGYLTNIVPKQSCTPEAATRGVLEEKVFLESSQNSQENTCPRVSFLIKLQAVCNFIKKETLTKVFSCKFCEISKNTFFTVQVWATASNTLYKSSMVQIFKQSDHSGTLCNKGLMPLEMSRQNFV